MSNVSSLHRVLRRLRTGAAGVTGHVAWLGCQAVLVATLAVLRLTDRGQAGERDLVASVPMTQQR